MVTSCGSTVILQPASRTLSVTASRLVVREGEVEQNAAGRGKFVGGFEDLQIVAATGVEHAGAFAVGIGPGDLFGEAHYSLVEGEGGVPGFGFQRDVMKATAAEHGVNLGYVKGIIR